jgi:hypothetical protein
MKSPSVPAILLALICCLTGPSFAQTQDAFTSTEHPASAGATLTADEIMARVAANQDRSEEARKQYLYRQQIHVALKRTNGKLVREEDADYHVVPQADKTERKLEKITGKYWKKGKYEQFSGEPVPDTDHLDAELVKDMREDLIEPKSKDGIGQNLIPFSSEKIKKHVFKLVGRETFQGHDAYRISFKPADKEDLDWAGEAYIDANDFEPIYVYTKLARKIPLAVRTLLGTDVPGYGYSLRYEKQPGGVWFPKSYGQEFTLHVLFFYNREVMVSMNNKDFEQTHVDTKITAEAPPTER